MKIAKPIGVINKVKDFILVHARRQLYCTLILPYLQYCNIVWGNCYSTNLDKIFKLQKRAVRIIANAGFADHTRQTYFP